MLIAGYLRIYKTILLSTHANKERTDKMSQLNILIKPASGNCNMRCDYCFYQDEMCKREQANRGYMTEDTLKNVIRKTMLQADYQINYAFQGGEPTLCGLNFFKKVVAFQKQYNLHNIQVNNSLQTNGLNLTQEWCDFFSKNHFLIGISVDGTRALHNKYRHLTQGSLSAYDHICNSIRLLEQYHVDYNILTVITEDAAHQAANIYQNFKKNGWKNQQYIECLDPLYETENPFSYALQPHSYGVFLTELFDLWYKDVLLGHQPYIRRFENYISILAGFPPESCEQRGECGHQFVVESDGNTYPCDFYMLDAYLLGNFNTDRLPQMEQKREQIHFIERSRHLSSKCKACKYYALCRGGCQRSRIYVSAENAYINRFCESYLYFFDHCYPRMQTLAQQILQNLSHK